MEQTYLTAVNIVKVRHLQDINIHLDNNKRKHLIFTGKNGSGKTSVLDALVDHFRFVIGNFNTKEKIQEFIDFNYKQLAHSSTEDDKKKNIDIKENISFWKKEMKHWNTGAVTECTSFSVLREKYMSADFILENYKANRLLKVEITNTIENIKPQKT